MGETTSTPSAGIGLESRATSIDHSRVRAGMRAWGRRGRVPRDWLASEQRLEHRHSGPHDHGLDVRPGHRPEARRRDSGRRARGRHALEPPLTKSARPVGDKARAIREGLDVETVAIYDLLTKPSLDAKEISRVKEVAVALLGTLKQEQLRVNQWREKEATRDAVRATIFDFLYSDNTGLPEAYTDDEIKAKSADVFQHVFYAYPVVPSPIYGTGASAR